MDSTPKLRIETLNCAMGTLIVPEVLKSDNLDLLLIQEVNISTEQLNDIVVSLGYQAESNIDALNPSKPGTAFIWRRALAVSEVTCLIERRAQSIKIGTEVFVNIYAPSGSANRRVRAEFWEELFPMLVGLGRAGLPIIGGDFNSILLRADTERNFPDKYCKVLDRLVKSLEYKDCFRLLNPDAREYTFHRASVAQSRLDRWYCPAHMAGAVVSVTHRAGLSDHSGVLMELDLRVGRVEVPRGQATYWRLNTSLLQEPDFNPQFKVLYSKPHRHIL